MTEETEERERPVRLNLNVEFKHREDLGDSRYRVTFSASGSVDNNRTHTITVNGLFVKTTNKDSPIFQHDADNIMVRGLDKEIPARKSWPIDHFEFKMETKALQPEQLEHLRGDVEETFRREGVLILLVYKPMIPNKDLDEEYPFWPHTEDGGLP